MMTVQRFPFLNGELDRMVRDMIRPFASAEPAPSAAFVPAIDVREEPEALVLEADLPGFKPEDLKLSFEAGVLTLSGERKERPAEKAATYHRVERAWGAFERRFQLPADVSGDAIEASYEAGVLTVRLGRRPEARPRTIEVKAK